MSAQEQHKSGGTHRPDGRTSVQLRPPVAEQGILNRADGSVRFMMGNTSVLVAVYGPAQPVSTKKEQADRACIEVTWKSEKGISLGAVRDRRRTAPVVKLVQL
jgi:ribonuclease PH